MKGREGRPGGARLRISPAAALAAGLALLLTQTAVMTAAAAAVLIHELAHIAALRLCGLRVREISAQVGGACISYTGYTGLWGELLAAAAGPAAGLAYAALALHLAAGGCEWLARSGRISLLLSAFNLLPVLPLDGGRIVLLSATAALGESGGTAAARVVGAAALLALAATALYVISGAAKC